MLHNTDHEKVKEDKHFKWDLMLLINNHELQLGKKLFSLKDWWSRQSVLIVFMFVCFSFTKLHLLMRLRCGPSPASCSVSGIHLPACTHASTPGIKEREKEKKIKATANYVDMKECDKAIANRGWQSLCLFYHKLEDSKYWQNFSCWQKTMPTAWWS